MISIITPVLNGAKTIERTLKALSVQKADFEHIVQDGGSTDGTQDIVRQYSRIYPVRLCDEKDTGHFDALQRGMTKARGDVLAWINADDFYHPWTLATVQRVLAEHRDVHWITGIPAWYFEETGVSMVATSAQVYPRSWIRRGWFTKNRLGVLQQESMFWRRWLWERSAPEDILRQYRYAAEFHLWKRFAEHAELRTVAAVLACFTISSSQISRKFAEAYARECGLADAGERRPWAGRIALRLWSQCRLGRVIRPVAH
jgi:glycosyltransferase involved in cell wall biosynthesis